LVAGNDQLLRFDPWHARFEPSGLGLGSSQTAASFIAMGSDSFAWLADDGQGLVLRGLRLGTRSAFSNDVPLVTLRDSNDPSRPAHLTPDRPPTTELSYEEAGPGALAFASSPSGAGNPCVWISDARYADFSAEIAFSSGFSPSLRLGNSEFVAPGASNAGEACPLPALIDPVEGGRLQVNRVGNHVALTIAGAHSECLVASERLALGVCASELGPVRVTRVSVKRND